MNDGLSVVNFYTPRGSALQKEGGGLSRLVCKAYPQTRRPKSGVRVRWVLSPPPSQAIKLNVVFKYSYIIVALASGCVLCYALARYRVASFQNRGEALVRLAIQARFEAPDFHLLNHITLQLGAMELRRLITFWYLDTAFSLLRRRTTVAGFLPTPKTRLGHKRSMEASLSSKTQSSRMPAICERFRNF